VFYEFGALETNRVVIATSENRAIVKKPGNVTIYQDSCFSDWHEQQFLIYLCHGLDGNKMIRSASVVFSITELYTDGE